MSNQMQNKYNEPSWQYKTWRRNIRRGIIEAGFLS